MEFSTFGCAGPSISLQPQDDSPTLDQVDKHGLLPEFYIHAPLIIFGFTDQKVGIDNDLKPRAEKVPFVRIQVKVQRKAKPYLFKVVNVLMLIQLGTAAAFVMSPVDQFDDRLGHTSTMFLAAVVFQFIDYLTILDKYIIAVTMHIVGTMLLCSGLAWYKLDEAQLNNSLLVANTLMPFAIAGMFGLYLRVAVIPSETAKLKATPIELEGMSGQGKDTRFSVRHSDVAENGEGETQVYEDPVEARPSCDEPLLLECRRS